MTRAEYRSAWAALMSEHRDDYRELLEMDPFSNWERNAMPESTAERQLGYGLLMLYTDAGEQDARSFLERSRDLVQRAQDEKALEGPRSRKNFPKNRGRLLRAGAYARAVLDESWSPEELLNASRDLEEWCKGYSPRKWDSQAEANHLAAVRLALIGRDPARALSLLASRRFYEWHAEEAALLREIAHCSAIHYEGAATDLSTKSL